MTTLFEWDPDKNEENDERHGVRLEQAQALWEARPIILPAKKVRDEQRFFIIGKIGGQIYVAVFTYRGVAIRLISCHRAGRRLERIYEETYEKAQED